MTSRPAQPVVGVGAVVLDGDRVLLVKRGKEPLRGRWLIPGGTVELGESLTDAVVREVREETGLTVRPGEVVLVFDRIEREGDDVRFHYVIVDYDCALVGGELAAGSDADDAVFAPVAELERYDVPPQARELVRRVFDRRRTTTS
jgi:ADP-ribose pyrophosphatase YjhB (NUDIX family)